GEEPRRGPEMVRPPQAARPLTRTVGRLRSEPPGREGRRGGGRFPSRTRPGDLPGHRRFPCRSGQHECLRGGGPTPAERAEAPDTTRPRRRVANATRRHPDQVPPEAQAPGNPDEAGEGKGPLTCSPGEN